MSTTDFDDIYKNGSDRVGSQPNYVLTDLNINETELRIAANGLGWKQVGEGADKPTTVAKDDMRQATWCRVARNFQIKIIVKDRNAKPLLLDNFKRDDFERLQNLFKNNFNVNLEQREITQRGWNWGKAEIYGQDLTFWVAGKTAFSVPINQIHNTSITKSEVAIEFLPPSLTSGDDKKKKRGGLADELMEMRLYIPGSEANALARARRQEKAARKNGENGEVKAKKEGEAAAESEESSSDGESDPDPDGEQAANTFFEKLKDQTESDEKQSAPIVEFSEVHCTTPRGRYNIEMLSDFLRLRNKSYDYKILYSSIRRLYMLPKNDDINVQLVVNVDPPIRQGQTRYPYLVMQFPRDEVMEAELVLENAESKHPDLQEKYNDTAYEVVSKIFKAVSGKKLIVPSVSFESHDGQQAVKCNVRTAEGHLYLLDKSLLWISKSPVLVAYNDITAVNFERVTSAMSSVRSFDLRIEQRGESDVTFSALVKEEQSNLSAFFESKKIKVREDLMEDMVGTNQAVAAALAADASSSDGGDASDDSAAAERRQAAKGKTAMDLDDDESEVDEDFKAPDSGSDVAEEYDENYSSSNASSGDEAAPAKSKKKKATDEGDSPQPKKKQKKSRPSE